MRPTSPLWVLAAGTLLVLAVACDRSSDPATTVHGQASPTVTFSIDGDTVTLSVVTSSDEDCFAISDGSRIILSGRCGPRASQAGASKIQLFGVDNVQLTSGPATAMFGSHGSGVEEVYAQFESFSGLIGPAVSLGGYWLLVTPQIPLFEGVVAIDGAGNRSPFISELSATSGFDYNPTFEGPMPSTTGP